jgi:hypothetical protein
MSAAARFDLMESDELLELAERLGAMSVKLARIAGLRQAGREFIQVVDKDGRVAIAIRRVMKDLGMLVTEE